MTQSVETMALEVPEDKLELHSADHRKRSSSWYSSPISDEVEDLRGEDDQAQMEYIDAWKKERVRKNALKDQALDQIRNEDSNAGALGRIKGAFRRLAVKWKYR